MLNNRELATVVWLVVFAIWALSRAEVRSALRSVCESLFVPDIVATLLAYYVGLAAVVWLMLLAGFGGPGIVLQVLVWSVVSGIPICIRSVTSSGMRGFGWYYVLESLKGIAVLEFLSTLVIFSFTLEMFFVPLVTVCAVVVVYGEGKEDLQPAKGCLASALGAAGIILLVLGVRQALSEGEIAGYVQSFFLPVLLAAVMSPLAYLFALASVYERLLLLLECSQLSKPDVIFFALWRLPVSLGFSIWNVEAFGERYRSRLMSISSREEVVEVLSEWRTAV